MGGGEVYFWNRAFFCRWERKVEKDVRRAWIELVFQGGSRRVFCTYHTWNLIITVAFIPRVYFGALILMYRKLQKHVQFRCNSSALVGNTGLVNISYFIEKLKHARDIRLFIIRARFNRFLAHLLFLSLSISYTHTHTHVVDSMSIISSNCFLLISFPATIVSVL